MAFTCETCWKTFIKKSQLLEHQRTENHWKPHVCTICGKSFGLKHNLNRHASRHMDPEQFRCLACSRVFSKQNTLTRHIELVHNQSGGAQKRGNSNHGADPAPKRRLLTTDDPKDFYDMHKTKEVYINKFNTKASTYTVSFKDLEVEGLHSILQTLQRMFQAILDDVTLFSKSKDLIQISIQCPELDFPVTLPFMRKELLTAELLLSEIERVLQSYEEFVLDNTLEIAVTHVGMPDGGSWKGGRFVNLERLLKAKQCIIQIKNKDTLCCARAIVTAKARLDKHPQLRSIRQGRYFQTKLAEELHLRADVPLGKCGISEIQKFQTMMPDYQINVVSRDFFNSIIYSGPDSEKKLYVYNYGDHYAVITSMPAFLNRNYYCTTCQKGYNHKEKHKCNNACPSCRKIHESTGGWMHCNDCNRYFRGQECIDLHKKSTEKGRSTCTTYYKCTRCSTTINKDMNKKEHVCGESYCKTCKAYYPEGHLCHMMPHSVTPIVEKPSNEATENMIWEDSDEKHDKIKPFIFFDFECTQDDLVQCVDGFVLDDKTKKCVNCLKSTCGSLEHKPNLCVAQKVCDECLDRDVTPHSQCENCEKNEVVFAGISTTDEFCEWLFSEDNEGAIVLCHNFKGYDSFPILQYLYRNGIKPDIIPHGAKIMSLFVPDCKIKMIDSLNFLPTALVNLPDMFKLNDLEKGYFPHLYNSKENQTKVLDHLPDVHYYNPDGMKPAARETFLKWYEANKNRPFDLQKELLKYCRSDVDILRRCCLKFRDLFMTMTKTSDKDIAIDPFEHCCTIASACNLVFRTRFLQSETIGIIKHHGYRPEETQSVKALQWIKWLSREKNLRIQHAKNGGEKRIDHYRMDGYYETESGEKVVLEFHGCFWHGCNQCYARDTINPVNDMSMGDLHERTLDKQRYLESRGYVYISKWEHAFDRDLRENPDQRKFVEQLDLVTPLIPRDAFFGGRTEAFTLFKDTTGEESIDYYDVTSLYPWVNKTGKVPVGHPNIITEHFGNIQNYEGLIKCKVLPPRALFVPVLPYRVNGKLMFPLCRVCTESKQQTPCQHDDVERLLTGTWVTDELKKALEKGYTLVKIHEVWHFDKVAQYDPDTKTGGVFTDYVNTFLKTKQEASGWPDWCHTEDDKQNYIKEYYEREGVLLNYINIVANKGLRSLAKLMLNR
jgi:hypothetical protein